MRRKLEPTTQVDMYEEGTGKWLRRAEQGFRISVDDGAGGQIVTMNPPHDLVFQRLEDCEMAMAALDAVGLNTPTALKKAGLKKIREIACGALQW